ncbi:YbjN domain-containing protein [Streptantibioticus ferralitis]|uniref:YbjN domain-containing protein n=1 Tax=Streptantibioticus ferralitis TaxID=236510 RepID=A0ABT5Z7T2_9ACTN|nr:YbjN domain-containing protein [Streptantibioticus ferralitis]MDF2259881.1 YbjN domain-containing protein [Streptantibioticus ferralitis]
MSIDPSSIPNFGQGQGPSDQPPAGPPGGGVIRPDQDLVKQLLDQMELKYVVDDEGDLAAPWEDFRTYFMFRGEGEQEVFAVRTFYDRAYSIEEKNKLLEIADGWNRQTLWPKVYSHTHDDGSVRLIGEAQMLLGLGVGLEHFVSSTVSWVRASIDFDRWVTEQLGLEKDAESDGEDGDENDEG